MNKMIAVLEKSNPFFTKLSNNKYMSAIRNGFMAPMYLIMFSSVFMIVAYLPNTFGFIWPPNILANILVPYNYSMGFLGLFLCGTMTKALVDEINNKELEKGQSIDVIAAMFASMVSYFIMLSDPLEGGMATAYMGSSGIFASIVIAFVVGNIYKFCIKNNVTIKLPEEVPPNIAGTFRSVFAFSFSVLFFWIFNIIFRNYIGVNLGAWFMQILSPLFNLGDSYLGFIVIFGAIPLLTFIGLHGTSIVYSAIAPLAMMNLAANQAALAAGEPVAHALTSAALWVTLIGGSGNTLMVCAMFAFMSKSKQNKAIGKASIVPTFFGVNEPILFGGPIIMNPIFLIPYVISPVFSAVLYKFFVSSLGMTGGIVSSALGIPALVTIPMQANFHILSFVLLAILVVVGSLIYYPFFKSYDAQMVRQEQEKIAAGELDEEVEYLGKTQNEIDVLVMCIGGGTSGLLANTIAKGAKAKELKISSAACAYGAHVDVLKNYNLVILAPQAGAYFDEIKKETDKYGIQLVTTTGPEYIGLSKDLDKAIDFTIRSFNK